MNLSGKSILLTGASSGIGYAVANKLSKENCKVAILARNTDKLREFASEFSSANSFILPIHCDVSDQEQVNSAFNTILAEFGEIDIAILNAGTSYRIDAGDFSADKGKEVVSVNLTGNFYFLEKLIPYFISKKRGMIVGVSSLADTKGFPRSGVYNASKAAFSKVLESLRIELSGYGIKVITVRPGFVKTPMTDKNEFYMPLMMSPEKAAGIIVAGIKKEKRKIQFPFLTVVGTNLLGIIPDSIFEFFARKHLERLKRKEL